MKLHIRSCCVWSGAIQFKYNSNVYISMYCVLRDLISASRKHALIILTPLNPTFI